MKKTLNITLAVVVDTDLTKAGDIVDNLSFPVVKDLIEDVQLEVVDSEIVDYFEV